VPFKAPDFFVITNFEAVLNERSNERPVSVLPRRCKRLRRSGADQESPPVAAQDDVKRRPDCDAEYRDVSEPPSNGDRVESDDWEP
jgi:hypothetical protein